MFLHEGVRAVLRAVYSEGRAPTLMIAKHLPRASALP